MKSHYLSINQLKKILKLSFIKKKQYLPNYESFLIDLNVK